LRFGFTGAGKSSSTDKNSIAVLPFANMSTDPEQEYFCDGMSRNVGFPEKFAILMMKIEPSYLAYKI